jgi:hypothetical protein
MACLMKSKKTLLTMLRDVCSVISFVAIDLYLLVNKH